jgi:hypothetical protein
MKHLINMVGRKRGGKVKKKIGEISRKIASIFHDFIGFMCILIGAIIGNIGVLKMFGTSICLMVSGVMIIALGIMYNLDDRR